MLVRAILWRDRRARHRDTKRKGDITSHWASKRERCGSRVAHRHMEAQANKRKTHTNRRTNARPRSHAHRSESSSGKLQSASRPDWGLSAELSKTRIEHRCCKARMAQNQGVKTSRLKIRLPKPISQAPYQAHLGSAWPTTRGEEGRPARTPLHRSRARRSHAESGHPLEPVGLHVYD